MSTKHFFPTTDGVVLHALSSFAARNPHLKLDLTNRVIYSKTHSPSKVTLISGGGSGHEPAWSGYVGEGMLTAAVSGDVFASPSTKQIMAAIKNVPSEAGIILCITNYTGDMLHFGLAREKGQGLGYNIEVVCMAEDAALGRKKSELVGRRGLAGNLLVLKLLGAASQKGWSFEKCLQLGNQGNSQLVTIGTSLDHCHVPGRAHHEAVPNDACELGMGIHNEPGLRTISPMPSAEDVIKEMLVYLVDPNDSDRAFVKFAPDDEVVMLVNNFGGLSNLELEALTNITRTQLDSDWNIKLSRIYAGVFETSLNGPGFSITLGNLSGIAQALGVKTEDVIELLDAPTTAPAWPKNAYAYAKESEETAKLRREALAKDQESASATEGPKAPEKLLQAVKTACTRAVEAEPDITKYDIQMGDGDCGEAVFNFCNSILKKLSTTSNITIFELLHLIDDSVEDVGGSLGAILSILITAFSNNLRKAYRSNSSSLPLTASTVGSTIGPALENLKLYTSARQGDRTVMDALIPFCEVLQETENFKEAVEAGADGARKTAAMAPRFGRASYVGEERTQKEMPPDPGAFAAGVFLKGLLEGLRA